MAKRYCGDAVIDVRWVKAEAQYRAVVSPGVKVQFTRVVHPPIAMGSPDAYDAAARAALAKVLDMTDHAHDLIRTNAREAADLAASGIIDGQYQIRRCP